MIGGIFSSVLSVYLSRCFVQTSIPGKLCEQRSCFVCFGFLPFPVDEKEAKIFPHRIAADSVPVFIVGYRYTFCAELLRRMQTGLPNTAGYCAARAFLRKPPFSGALPFFLFPRAPVKTPWSASLAAAHGGEREGARRLGDAVVFFSCALSLVPGDGCFVLRTGQCHKESFGVQKPLPGANKQPRGIPPQAAGP